MIAPLDLWLDFVKGFLVLSLSRVMSVAAVAEMTEVHANRLWRIPDHYVERARTINLQLPS